MSLAQIERSESGFVLFCFFFFLNCERHKESPPNKGAVTLGLQFVGGGGAYNRKASAHHWEEWSVGALLLGVTSRRSPERTPATHEKDRQDEPMSGHAESMLLLRVCPLERIIHVHRSVTVLNWGSTMREVGRKEKSHCLGDACMGRSRPDRTCLPWGIQEQG